MIEVEEFSSSASDLPCGTGGKKRNKPRKRKQTTTEKVERFGIKGTDTEESACTGVVKGKQNGEQVRIPRKDAKIKQLHSSKQACKKEG